MDVFANLNKYLEKDEDSFKYESFRSESSQSGNQSESELVDLSDIIPEPETAKTPKSKGSRRRRLSVDLIPDASFDLTDPNCVVTPPKRSRRAADEFNVMVSETIELNFPEPEISDPKPRRGRKPKGQPKTKKLTYKQALALVNAPIPEVNDNFQTASHSSQLPVDRAHTSSSFFRVIRPVATQTFDIDLTGDVVLTDKHSTAPLFQKRAPTSTSKPDQAKSGTESDDDADFDPDAIRIKVRTASGIKMFNFRQHQRYYELFKTLSEVEGCPVSSVYLFDDDKRIRTDDTPHSTGYKITTILHCRIMEMKAGCLDNLASNKENEMSLKFQSDKWKKPITIKVSKLFDFGTIVKMLCEEIPFKADQVSLKFDGEDVVLSDTPMDLEFEGGEILDCKVKV